MVTMNEVLQFKDVLHHIPKPSRPYSVFKDFTSPGKMDTFFKDFQGRVATLIYSAKINK